MILALLLAFEVHLAADGQPIRWAFAGDGLVSVRLITPPPQLSLLDLRGAITQAAEAWQAVESAHVPVRYLGQVAARDPQPGEVLVSFDTGGDFPGGNDTTGFTTLTLDGDVIAAARVHLNAAQFDWTTTGLTNALDVQSIVEHELGHALGLAHPCGDADTQTPSCASIPSGQLQALQQDVMFPSIPAGARRALAQDDIDGITFLLPAAAPPEIAPELTGLSPSCLEESQAIGPGLSRNVAVQVGRAPDPAVLELLNGDAVVAQAALGRDGSGRLVAIVPPDAMRSIAPLDARLVARSGKATVLFDAIDIAKSCGKRGCSTSSGGALGALALLLFPAQALARARARRRARKPAPAPAPARARAGGWFWCWGLVLVVVLVPVQAFAYKRSVNSGNVCIWWSTRGHPFQIDAQGTPDVPAAQAFTAVRKSAQTWAAVACSDLAFQDQGLSQDPKNRVVGYFPGQFNRNLVLWRTRRCGNGQNGGVVPPGDGCLTAGGCSNAYDCWDHGDGVIATTTTTSNRFTGQINDTDIEINDAVGSDGSKFSFTAVDGPPCTDINETGCVRIDIQNTITHEWGHTLGLDHTTDPNATMYATAPEGEVSKRVLGSDDIQGICDIYPRGSRTVTCDNDPIDLKLAGSSNGGCGCSQAQTGPGAALALAALLLHISRRSRRRPQTAIIPSSGAASSSLRRSVHRS